jgi:hypothetical protein
VTVVDIDPATGAFGIPLERDLHDTPFDGWIPKMWRIFPDGSRLLTGEGTIYQTDDNLSYDSTITIEPFEDYDSPWIRDACFYNDYLVTLEATYEESGISFYHIDPPYDRVQPRVEFGVRGRRIFSDNEFIYLIAERYEDNFIKEIYKIDSSILE